LAAGLRGIFASRAAAAATVIFAVNVIVLGVWYVGAPGVATHQLHMGQGGVATVMAFYGAGGLLGALATLSIGAWRGLAGVLAGGLLGTGVFFAVLGMIGVPALGLALSAATGAGGAVIYAIAPTLVQRGVSKAAMVPAIATLQS